MKHTPLSPPTLPLACDQLGEVRSFIRLLQDGDKADGAIPDVADPNKNTEGLQILNKPPTSDGEVLTLAMLQAFVDGGDAFLERREAELQKRQQQHQQQQHHQQQQRRRDSSWQHRDIFATLPASAISSAAETGISLPIVSRRSSWTEDDDDDNDQSRIPTDDQEEARLAQLRVVFDRTTQSTDAAAATTGGGGLRGHLSSFDLDDSATLSVQQLAAAIRSLGGRGIDFGGLRGLKVLMCKLSGAGTDSAARVSINELVRWFDGCGASQPARDAARHDVAGVRGGDDNGRGRKMDDGGSGKRAAGHRRIGETTAGEALRRAIRLAEAKGTTLERTFARLDEDGDGFITLRQLLRGLDGMGVFEHVSGFGCMPPDGLTNWRGCGRSLSHNETPSVPYPTGVSLWNLVIA